MKTLVLLYRSISGQKLLIRMLIWEMPLKEWQWNLVKRASKIPSIDQLGNAVAGEDFYQGFAIEEE